MMLRKCCHCQNLLQPARDVQLYSAPQSPYALSLPQLAGEQCQDHVGWYAQHQGQCNPTHLAHLVRWSSGTTDLDSFRAPCGVWLSVPVSKVMQPNTTLRPSTLR